MDKVYKYIIQKTVTDRIERKDAVQLLELLKYEKDKARRMDIAVIGLSAKTSQAKNAEELWYNLENGFDGIREIPEERRQDLDDYLRFKGSSEDFLRYKNLAYLETIDKFDYEYFGLSPREGELLDPNQRLFLESACATIEDAGYDKNKLKKSRTGLYLGFITANYNYQNLLYNVNSDLGAKTILSNMAALIPSRVSYALDLRGPSILVDTACSSSLVAIHLACQALRLRECDQALVGGVKINLLPLKDGPKLGIESSTGKTLAFDEASDGTGQGEGVGVVMLKPLQDALRDGDNVRAVIKGSAINQDGQSLGISAPNPQAQTEVIKSAWRAAEINPSDISYIEAHGTGTSLGDPIEIEGITKAFQSYTDKKQFCALSSIKSNIGHLDEAAGVFGLIKAVLSLEKKKLPASINFHEPNHKINWEDSPVFVNTDFIDWQKRNSKLRLAGVSSFGLSGTNCHVVLEEAPLVENKVDVASSKKIIKISARNQSSLKELISSYYSYLTDNSQINFENFCYTVNVGRSDYEYRLVIIFDSREDLLKKLFLISGIEGSFTELEDNNSFFWGELKKNEDNFQSESEIKNRVINKILEKNRSKDFSEVDLEKISRLYTEGVNFDWSLLYRKEKRQRLSLPTYPFARKRCWFSLPKSTQKNNHFELVWREDKIVSDPIVQNEVLVFKDNNLLAQKIFEALKKEVGVENLIEVSLGDAFEKINDNKFIIGNRLTDYEKLFSSLAERKLYQIIHLFSVDDNIEASVASLSELEDKQELGVLSLFNLSKALAKIRRTEILNLVVVSNLVNEVTGKEKNIKPENAPLFGLTKGIFLEVPNWHCRAIDFDDEGSLDNLILEIRNEYHNHKIAYRAGKRYVEEFRPVIPERKEIKIRNQGVYVFTGGTGGVSLELEKVLSKQEKINLVIITRSFFPVRERWESLLKSENNSELGKQIKAFLEIEKTGTKIFFYQADVVQKDELKPVIQKIKNKFGQINGIVHAAGNSDDSSFDQKTEETFRNVLSAKIQGTWLLDNLTREFNLDFFSLISSAITCFGGVHNVDYIAGNSYLDSYAFWGRKQGVNFTSVNWSFWKNTGMHVRLKISHEKIPLKNISPRQGVKEWLLSLGNHRPGFSIVGEMNYVGRSVYLMKHSPFTFAPEILSEIEENINNFSHKKERDEVVVKGNDSSKYSEIEKNIAQTLYDVLGYKEIDIRDNFFDLGGDSLFLAEIFSRLEKEYSRLTNITQFFTYPTVAQLAKFLSEETGEKKNTEIKASEFKNRDIAVIGLAVKTSLANNYEELWENIKQKRECIREIPETRKRDIDNYLRMAGVEEKYMKYSPLAYLEVIDKFDYEFFKFSPREAKFMDPNQRLFLETAITAIEEAGYGGEKLRGTNTGLYLGYGQSDFKYKSFISNSKMLTSTALFTGNLNSLIPSRISYLLDLRGPSMVVDTACSSSLVSVHLACQALLAGDCKQAIAGGVRLNLVPLLDRFKIGIESSDWYTRSFDNESDGTGLGEGVAAVILKPFEKALADGDDIKAVIKGSAVNQDGQSVGITAPNTRAQADVVLSAWMNAQINPADVSYIETHGTGTNLGDPVEIEALTNAFRAFTDKKQFCAISAVKPNLGHTLEASGIFSFVKAILALRDKQLPPSINFHEPNHRVDWENSAVYVNTSLTPWYVEGKKRLCGVSSFGLSGTNCHIVLSEAPQQNKFRLEKEKLNIFTLSAKNKLALSELVDNYLIYLDKSSNVSLSDLCFTVNTGRGQYEERLAIVVGSIAELKKVLLGFKQNGYQKLPQTDIFYNFYKVVSKMKKEKGDNKFTEKELDKLSREAEPFVAKAMTVSDISRGFLRKICELYTQGAKINWEEFYKTGTYRRLSLPTYPFQKTRCWADYNDQVQIESQTGSLNYLHPLLEKCLVKSPDQDVYQTIFSPKKHFVLSDHIINGSNVLPGTVYLEIAKQLGKLYYGDVPLEIKNISFITPVITDKDEYKEVQIVVREHNGFKKFFAASRLKNDSSSKWIRHVEGEIHTLVAEAKKVDWEDIKERCQKQKIPVDINKNAAGFIKFGLRWQNYHLISFGHKEALAELELPRDCVHDLETYYLHPPMLDMAAAAVSMVTGFKALPFYYESFRLFGPMSRKIYAHFYRIGEYDEVEETLSFDFDLLDPHGRVFAEVKNFKLKRTRDFTRVIKKNLGKKGEDFYKIYWEESLETPAVASQQDKIIILGSRNPRTFQLIKKLKQENKEFIEVNIGEEFLEVEKNKFVIKNSLEDFNRLFEKLKSFQPTKIIHAFSLASRYKVDSIADLDFDLNKNVFSLFYLIKALSNNVYREKIDIVLLTENVEAILPNQKINPIGATLIGFGKAVAMEDPNWRCRAIDIDKETGIDLIWQEINSTYSDYKIAWRNNKRYQEILRRYEIEKKEKKLVLQPGGAYLISGGAGSIGLELAVYLAEQEKIKLILVNRTSLADKEKWEELAVKKNDLGRRYQKILEVTERIEKSGSQVEFVKTDISDYDEMNSLFYNLKNKYGELKGIIHAAGVAGDGFIAKKEKENLSQVLLPKVQGTCLLDEMSKEMSLDFFVVFSSTTSLHSASGQSDYTAANAFLDAFSNYRNQKGRETLLINWSGWREIGMLFESKSISNYGLLSTAEALAGFMKVLENRVKSSVVGSISYIGEIFKDPKFLPLRFSNELKAEIFRKDKVSEDLFSSDRKFEELFSSDKNLLSNLEKVLVRIWQEVLGVKEIDVNDHFFDLGGDSLRIAEMHAILEKLYPGKFSVAELFAYPTINKLIQHVGEESSDKPESEKIKRDQTNQDIAIIGMAGRTSEAKDLSAFWENLALGKDCIREIPITRKRDMNNYLRFKGLDKKYRKFHPAAYLETIDKFDYEFFRISPREASLMDPNQRLLLETAYHAIENAGYSGRKLNNTKTGLYVGLFPLGRKYYDIIADVEPMALSEAMVNNMDPTVASRISYYLNLIGPSMLVNTACSSSLVAIHLACQAIKNGDCDQALVGSVKINLVTMANNPQVGIESSDGHTRTFDNDSDGTGLGEGVATVLLKPLDKALEDGDNIRAVIKGSAINQDGQSVGITAPNAISQTEVIKSAWQNAKINPADISYIEAHGTGTNLGDPIEIEALAGAFKKYTRQKQFCAISSVKSNLGHLLEAAGIFGLVKTVLSLEKEKLVPAVNFHEPNEKVNWETSPVFVNDRLLDWKNKKGKNRLAGVSAFGLAGTNCHVLLESVSKKTKQAESYDINKPRIFMISARSKEALGELLNSYLLFLAKVKNNQFDDICYTANTGRDHHNFRLSILASSLSSLRYKLQLVSELDFAVEAEKDINYGEFKIVQVGEKLENILEITEKEALGLGKKADLLVTEYVFGEKNYRELINKIGQLYAKGADYDWSKLYRNQRRERLPLPLYPFARKRCWLDIPGQEKYFEYYHGIKWREKELKTRKEKEGAILVFASTQKRSQEILKEFPSEKELVEVQIGETYQKKDDNNFVISRTKEDYKRLLSDLQDREIKAIVHLLSLEDEGEVGSVAELEKRQRNGIYSVMSLVQALQAVFTLKEVDLFLVSENSDLVLGNELVRPENATMIGFGKSIILENPNIRCHSIDIDSNSQAGLIWREIDLEYSDYKVAYRENKRYIEELGRINLDDFPNWHLPGTANELVQIRDGGVYLITGGTGGIGLKIAQALTERAKNLKLVLLGQHGVPGREEWKNILEAEGPRDKRLIEKVKSLKKLSNSGAKISFVQADISDEEKIRGAVKKVEEDFGVINGVFHTAGISGNGFIAQKGKTALHNSLAPKVVGTWLLGDIFKKSDLDFMVLFSSAITLISGVGVSDYTAANSYLDAYAYQAFKKDKRVLSVDWSTWENVGLSFGEKVNKKKQLLKILPIETALDILFGLIKKEMPRVVVGKMNYESDLVYLGDYLPLNFSAEIDLRDQERFEVAKKQIKKVKLKGREDDKYTKMEKELASIWSEVLGYDEIDIRDNFFELGGDSLSGIRLISRVNQKLNRSLSFREILQNASLKALARYVSQSDEVEYTPVIKKTEPKQYQIK